MNIDICLKGNLMIILKLIQNFWIILDLTNEKHLFGFILKTIKLLNSKNEYIIVFDNFKDKFVDKNSINEMLKYINNNVQLIGCCSLKDKEIRKMKIYLEMKKLY